MGLGYTIKIGGEAGQGLQTIGDALSHVFTRAGFNVFTYQDYESRIRGGHNFTQIRFSDAPALSPRERVDILVALDRESIPRHEAELSEAGIAVYDSASLKQKYEKENFFDIPIENLALEHGGSKLMANTVATGAVLGILGMGLDILSGIIRDAFGRKGEDVVNANLRAAGAGHEFARKGCLKCAFTLPKAGAGKMLMAGNEAVALGALASGLKFYAAYPMTPSTGIMLYAAGKAKDFGVVVEQAEDEIAAINMALGASFAGVRAMTGTATGGFSLMVEGLSLAGMTETPVVIAVGQRPAPATGLPTRTEQADLLFVCHAAHGEFPRVVFAPGTPEQAFYLTNKAFDLAEKYQIPAFILTDQHLADSQWSCDGLDLSRLRYNDYRLRGDAFKGLKEYKRHAFTETGVSPLAVPGDAPYLVVTDSDEHDEEGHIIEDAATRIKMVEKRLLRKLPLIKKEISPPLLYGSEKPDVVLVGWGSTYGVLKEAVDELSKGKSIAMLHFTEVCPFPEDAGYLGLLNKARLAIAVENNATGQFARLMRAETGFEFQAKVNRFDGRPFALETLIAELNAEIGRL